MGSKSKEGGYGWCVVVASFCIQFIVGGIGYSASVFQHIFSSYFQKDEFQAAWIPAMLLGFTALAGIPSVLFVYQFGHRVTVIVGGLAAALGLLLSNWCQNLHEVYVTIGALTGLGLGLSLTPSITILDEYFYKKQPMAVAIAACGTSLGIFAFPVALDHLEEHFAWKGMALILSGIALNICLCGALFSPKSHYYTASRKNDLVKLFNTTILRSNAFMGLMWSNLIWGVGISIIYTFLPAYSASTGESYTNGVMLIAVSGISAFSSRTVFQIFSQSAKLDSISMFLCTIVMTAILTGLHPQLFTHFAGQIGYAIMLGLHTGFWSIFLAYITEEFIGPEFMCLGKGYVMLSISVGFITGAPLAGWVLDAEKDFEIIFYLAGACTLLSSIIMMGITVKKCYYKPQDWSDAGSESSGASGNRVDCKKKPLHIDLPDESMSTAAGISSIISHPVPTTSTASPNMNSNAAAANTTQRHPSKVTNSPAVKSLSSTSSTCNSPKKQEAVVMMEAGGGGGSEGGESDEPHETDGLMVGMAISSV